MSLLLARLLRLRDDLPAHWDPEGLSSLKSWDGAALFSGVWRAGGENPAVSHALAPHRCCAHPSIPQVQEAASALSPSRNSPNFSQKFSPEHLAQRLESFMLPCIVPRHHLHVGADGHGISPGPTFCARSAWKNQKEDAELRPIFLGTTAVSVGLGAAWDRPLAAPPWQCSSVQNKPRSEIYFRAYSYPSFSAHCTGFPRSFSFAFLPATTSRKLHVKVPRRGAAAVGSWCRAGPAVPVMGTDRLAKAPPPALTAFSH